MRVGFGSLGTVDVSDRTARDLGFIRDFWYNELRAGRAFARGTDFAASAGNNGHIQLFNPGGSAITVLVRGIVFSAEVAGFWTIRQHNTALATLVGAGINLLSGAAASVAGLRTAYNAGVLGTEIVVLSRPASALSAWPWEWFIELGAGEGVLVAPTSTNERFQGSYEWVEF